ncbi:non-ribosomal peptide synthetase, partial [Pseudoduganella namucuonensis]
MSNSVNASVHQHTLSGPGWREIAEYCGRQAIPAGRFLDALCGFLLGRYGGHRQPFTMVASDGPLLVGCAEGGPAGDIAATLRMDAAAAADGGGLGAPRFQARIGPDEARLLLEHAGEGVDGDCLLRRMELVGRQIVGGAARWERLSLLDGAEARRMLRDWNDTAESGPGPHTVHELFEQQARRAPGRVAVVCGGQTLTYGELNVRANQLARHLRQAGAGADTLVGLCVERSLEMIVGLLGILKSGAAYVPLDASYPAERLRHMLEDARPLMLLTQERLLERLPPVDAPALCLDTAWPALAAHSAGDLAPISGPEHLCYVIYTSGSTGKPKGATIQHQGLHNLVRWYIRHYEVSADDRALIFSSISFDLTQKNIFAMLAVGAQVHLPADGYAPDLAFRQIEEEGITILNCATRAFYPLLSYQTPERPLRLRQVLIGGEVVNSQLLADAFRHTARPPLFHNTYGPTETSDINCSFQFDPREPQDNVPLGLPIDNTRFYVLDAWLNPVPPGVPGELHIGGVCVGRGYLRRPGLTAEKFIPDPFCGEPGARMYKSGDLARQRADGTVEFLGRIDQQVKIRGFRIEPGEIEAALTALPGVREAAVLAREDSPGDKRLVAYAVARDGAALDPAALRAGLAASLPEHMVPAHYVLLERLPLTPNGKTDRKALPAPDLKRGDDGYTAPAGATAQALAAIWADTLGLDRVGADDNFFALGGHSLLATQVLSKLRAAFGLELPVRALFEAPTVAALAARVDSALQGGVSADLAPIAPAPAGVPPRLSFAQQRLWFLDQYEPGSP